MAEGARRSNALGWAVLGFLAGVAVTLGVLTFLTPGHAHYRETPSEAQSAAPPAPVAREEAPPRPSAAKPAPSSAASSAMAAAGAVDQQVQEDAAAAGMTSRRQSSAEPAPN